MARGEISKKNITPKTIGLTNLPIKIPKLNQALLNNAKNLGLTIETRTKEEVQRTRKLINQNCAFL